MSKQLHDFLFKPSDASLVSIYRIIFGCFMIYQMIHYFQLDYTYHFMSRPQVLFPYPYLAFLQPLPLAVLKGIHIGLFIAAICITLGYWYRYAITFFFLGFSYFSFIDKTLYNNHIYLIALLAFAMIFIEADKKYSLRAWLAPKKRIAKIPAWNQYILTFLIALPYFFGGIAKLSSNWLDSKLTDIIVAQSRGSILHRLFSEELLANFLTYGGILYDLSIVFLLLFKRTRILGLVLVILFNITNNSILFQDIGLFPLLMICSTILFFNSKKVGQFVDRLFPKKAVPKTGKKAKSKTTTKVKASTTPAPPTSSWTSRKKRTAALLGFFIIFQLLFPFRYLPFTDNPEWTGIGAHFSWRMKLQSRNVTDFYMSMTDRTSGVVSEIDGRTFLSANQLQHVFEDPYNFIHFAKWLSKKAEEKRGIVDPIINADIKVSFNGLPPQHMIVPRVDLTRLKENYFAEKDWIVPLNGRE